MHCNCHLLADDKAHCSKFKEQRSLFKVQSLLLKVQSSVRMISARAIMYGSREMKHGEQRTRVQVTNNTDVLMDRRTDSGMKGMCWKTSKQRNRTRWPDINHVLVKEEIADDTAEEKRSVIFVVLFEIKCRPRRDVEKPMGSSNSWRSAHVYHSIGYLLSSITF